MRWPGALALLAWAAACAAAPAPPPSPSAPPPLPRAAPPRPASSTERAGLDRAPTAREARAIAQLMRETERVRGLPFTAAVQVRIQDRRTMRAFVRAELDDAELARARARYLALGMITPQLSLRELLERVLEDQLIGYYDPKRKRLAIRDDVAAAFGDRHASAAQLRLWRATVVHELVHALQDQHFHIGEGMARERHTDAANAYGALLEGDATLAMLAYTARRRGMGLEELTADPEGLRQGLVSPRALGALASAPAILREPLLFRYREGAYFAAALARRGGYRRVDEAFSREPTSTQEILEPERFAEAAPVPAARLPRLEPCERAGYAVRDQDVLGRLELGLYLRAGGAQGTAVASAWRGDRYAVLERAGALALVWLIRFSDEGAARRAAALARAGFAAAASRDGGSYLARAHGRAVAILRNLDPSLHRATLDALWAATP